MVEKRNCMNCDGTMERTDVTTAGVRNLYIETERDGGVLDMLGVGDHVALQGFVCTSCGLTQLYAEDIEDAEE